MDVLLFKFFYCGYNIIIVVQILCIVYRLHFDHVPDIIAYYTYCSYSLSPDHLCLYFTEIEYYAIENIGNSVHCVHVSLINAEQTRLIQKRAWQGKKGRGGTG